MVSTSDSPFCNYCLTTFHSYRGQTRHSCNFVLDQNDDGNLLIVLKPPQNLEETIQFLEKNLCVTDIIQLCRLQNWALKGYWPLVFPGRGHSVPLLSQYTAGSRSEDHLRQLIKDNQRVTLPKKLIIEDDSRCVKALLKESILEPRGHHFTSSTNDLIAPNQVLNTSHSSGTLSAQSDIEDEIFFGGSQFGDIPYDPHANDDTLPHHSSQSSVPQSPQSAFIQSQAPPQSTPGPRISFQSVLPENMDQGLDGLGKFNIVKCKSQT